MEQELQVKVNLANHITLKVSVSQTRTVQSQRTLRASSHFTHATSDKLLEHRVLRTKRKLEALQAVHRAITNNTMKFSMASMARGEACTTVFNPRIICDRHMQEKVWNFSKPHSQPGDFYFWPLSTLCTEYVDPWELSRLPTVPKLSWACQLWKLAGKRHMRQGERKREGGELLGMTWLVVPCAYWYSSLAHPLSSRSGFHFQLTL